MQEETLLFGSILIELGMDRYCMILADLVVADAMEAETPA